MVYVQTLFLFLFKKEDEIILEGVLLKKYLIFTTFSKQPFLNHFYYMFKNNNIYKFQINKIKMAAQSIEERFDIGFEDSKLRKVESVHQLSSNRLLELLGKLDSHENFQVHLRGRGFEIYGEVDEGTGMHSNKSIGAITSGYNLGKPSSCTYLVAFDYRDGEDKPLVPVTSLADVVRDYIIM